LTPHAATDATAVHCNGAARERQRIVLACAMPRIPKPMSARKMASKNSGLALPDASDDESVDDLQSNVSEESTNSILKDDHGSSDEADTSFEEKLTDALELASSKAAKDRTKALLGLCKAFSKKYIPWFVEDRRMTIADTIEKCLKRGKVDEQIAAANLVSVFCVQLGSDSNEETYDSLKTLLTPLLLDPTADPKTRAAVAAALGMTCFLLGEVEDFGDTLDNFERVFSGSYKGGAKLSPETLSMHTAALTSWTLLMSLMPPTKCHNNLESHMANFLELLASPDVDLRIAVGEAIVCLYENACDNEQLVDEAYAVVEEAVDVMKELAKDSHKYRSKKDKKEQKSSFRDIVHFIDDDEDFYEKSSFGQGELLEIDSWTQKKQYDALRKSLGSGTNIQLASNPLVREIFQLGSVVLDVDKEGLKNAKKHHIKVAKQSNMIKDLARGKNRDKKMAGMF
jgi:hypothetical protein